MNGAVRNFVVQSKACSVEVPGRQACTQDHDYLGTPSGKSAKTRFRIELFNQAIDFFLFSRHGLSVMAQGNFLPAFQLILGSVDLIKIHVDLATQFASIGLAEVKQPRDQPLD